MSDLQKLALLKARFTKQIAGYKLRNYAPYPWQREFHEAGLDHPERMLMAANRVGKTLSAGAECSYHLTGEYPEWWNGKRFDIPILCWTGSPTNETSRDIVQNELLGGLGERLGTGWIPRHKIIGNPTTRQAGVKNVVDSFQVRHRSGGVSSCILKTYEQGWQKWQGTAPHCIAEGQRILLADGRYVPIETIRPGDLVLTVNGNGKRIARRVLHVHDNGVREIVEINTSRGPWLRVTPDHKVYRASNEKVDAAGADRLWQIPSDWEPEPLVSLPDAYYAWLGLVLAEGTVSQRKITMGNEAVVSEASALLPDGATVKRKDFNNGHVPDWFLTWPDFWALVYPGLSHEKIVPDWVFMSPNAKIAIFLSYLYAGDGWASGHTVGYATTSRLLAEQISVLLWRLGVRSSVTRKPAQDEKWREQWWVNVSSADAVIRFSEKVGIKGKDEPLAAVTAEAMRRSHAKKSRGSQQWVRRDGSPEQRKEYLRLQSVRQRERYAAVQSIKPAGMSRVFDLTIETDHRFVAGLSIVSNCVWMDEEPDDYKIFSEAQTRILTSSGIVLVTFTPLLGVTELVEHFQTGGPGIYVRGASWNDAPHLDKEARERLASSYRAHERDARTQGIPMMGEGAVFPVPDDDMSVNAFEIPDHWARIKGCDFGIDHPAAGVEIAWDRDADVIYVIDCYKKAGETAPYHAAWFNKSNKTIPVAWPHDGMNREKSGGKTLAQSYASHGVNMLAKSARYPKARGDKEDKGGAQPVEPIVDEILERMMTGRFKVFAHLSQWFDEKRSYHRKDGKIVDKRDDILKATFYAVMMKRYAVAPGSYKFNVTAPQSPIASMRI